MILMKQKHIKESIYKEEIYKERRNGITLEKERKITQREYILKKKKINSERILS